MHVGVQLEHLEAVFLDVVFELERAILRAPTRVEIEIADEAIRIFLRQVGAVLHVIAHTVATLAVAFAVAGIAGWRLDKPHVNAARLAVDVVGPVHQLEHALTGERLAGVAPGFVDQIGRVQVGIDDHWVLRNWFYLTPA